MWPFTDFSSGNYFYKITLTPPVPPFTQFPLWLTFHFSSSPRAQAEANEYSIRLSEQSEVLQSVERQSEERGQQVEELRRLLENMEAKSSLLKDQMAAGEAELRQLKANGEEGGESEQRWDTVSQAGGYQPFHLKVCGKLYANSL